MLYDVKSNNRNPVGWRVSPDMGSDMLTPVAVFAAVDDVDKAFIQPYELRGPWGDYPAGTRFVAPPDVYLDLPVTVDERLPPNALMLDVATSVATDPYPYLPGSLDVKHE